jgi:hypothetical protein
MTKNVFLLSLVFSLCFAAVSSVSAQEADETVYADEAAYMEANETAVSMPRSFRALALGMSLDELTNALAGDGLFRFRGERDVSFLPVRQETLVETDGTSFIRRAHFPLAEGEVFIMSFTMDTRFIDHFSIFTTFVQRYGEPIILNPSEAVWQDDYTRVSIERPLTVKYVDRVVFERLREASGALRAWQTLLREEFLDQF